MTSNVSLAVWCKPKQQTATTTIEAHFNYWRIAGDANFRRSDTQSTSDFIEVGILVDDPTQIDSIRVFIPFEVERTAVTDCSTYFTTADIAQGIFNELLRGVGVANSGPRSVELLRGDNSVFARVHSFTKSNSGIVTKELDLEKRDNGTLLTISDHVLNDASALYGHGPSPAYFRLRIEIRDVESNPLIRVISTPDRLLQSSYDQIEYLDFRLNEARTLPDPLELDMRKERGAGVKMRLVAFLTAIPVQSEISISNTASHKMRLLEHDLWNAYMPGGIPEGMVVYHWKRTTSVPSDPTLASEFTGEIGDFTAFVKLRTRRSSVQIWVAYLLVAFVFGVLGNLAANLIQSCIDGRW
ncbi:hypothetical protein LB561_19810 [Mesorhizobium sp. B292B1B]|uniref:hypothetical protein n=1 Tax=unclassified Mesorhizobium TaxID=325217 RepID=UPI00112C6645|nr:MULTISPECIES: hypothetical protein [unclassified Mesorhizobium]MCA0015022.1 hypothetical protein [Mesorhizobium sp. B294B1A1]MCA0039526.1 hypothetical protein [Mesorhizobium sp. B292B1B]TPM43620.1 hypothetical protein FJ964_20295 [Mesorhizobium sp. B2-3-2]